MALAGRRRWPCSSSCISASTMPSMRTVRTTPPPPGSRPSWTSGKPSWTFGSSTTTRWWVAERDLQAAAERRAVDRGDDRLAERLQPAQLRLDLADAARRSRRRCSLVACERSLRSPPAKKVFFAEVRTTPVIVVLLGLEAVDGRRHRRRVGGVHRVGRLVGIVERQDDDAVVALLPADRGALSSSDGLHDGRDAHAAADAERAEAVLAAGAVELVDDACRGSSRRSRRAGGPWRSRRR